MFLAPMVYLVLVAFLGYLVLVAFVGYLVLVALLVYRVLPASAVMLVYRDPQVSEVVTLASLILPECLSGKLLKYI